MSAEPMAQPMQPPTHHVPVLRDAVLARAHLTNGMAVVDATLGGGGYACALLQRIAPHGALCAIDRDATAIARFRTQHPTCAAKIHLVHDSFANLAAIVAAWGHVPDVIVADLGLSSDQLDDPARGFSFLQEGPLDMRMDRSQSLTAQTLIATADAATLARIFRRYGDEPLALPIARAIVRARAAAPITTTRALAAIVAQVVRRPRRHHPATRVFQALRIAVNAEDRALERFLATAMCVLRPGGRLLVVTFHSGEERCVLRAFRRAARACTCPPALPVCQCAGTPLLAIEGTVRPQPAEIAANPRARSARLHVARILRPCHATERSTTPIQEKNTVL